jgi:hypothetical protein
VRAPINRKQTINHFSISKNELVIVIFQQHGHNYLHLEQLKQLRQASHALFGLWIVLRNSALASQSEHKHLLSQGESVKQHPMPESNQYQGASHEECPSQNPAIVTLATDRV